jgi:hypothetical protein
MASTTLGAILFGTLLPPVGLVVGSTVLWDAIDPITMRAAKKWNQGTGKFFARFMKHPSDGFMCNCLILFGGIIPLLFTLNLYSTLQVGFSWWRCYLYHVFRIGPYFMNFAYVYTLAHKEGHMLSGMFKDPYNMVLRNAFNFWVGLFYGVMPSSFAYGHTRNHHRYTNSPHDVVTTGDRPRDNFTNFIRYIPRFGSYAVNISTVIEFWQDGNYLYVAKMLWGTLVYWSFASLIFYIHPLFAMAYVVYPLLENMFILSAINWCWHAFIDPDDPDNDYAQSVTLLDGPVNVLNEDYHVVHHQYPSAHWTRNPELYKKHWDGYLSNQPTMFKGVHVMELFFLIILKKYREMAEKFVDPNDKMTLEDKEALIKARLQACSWGPYFNCKKRPKESAFTDPGAPPPTPESPVSDVSSATSSTFKSKSSKQASSKQVTKTSRRSEKK